MIIRLQNLILYYTIFVIIIIFYFAKAEYETRGIKKMKNAEKQNKAVNFKAEKVNGKKGFTLVELVVTIAILAILSAIAIPVVAYTLQSSLTSRAKTNAHTIEVAFKEANSLLGSKDNLKYANASSNSIKVSEVVSQNNIAQAFEPVDIYGTVYYPVMCKGKVYFALDTNGDGVYNSSDKNIDGNSMPANAVKLYDESTGSIIDCEISVLPLS